MECLIKTANN